MEYPKVLDNSTAHQPELIWRDFAMHNLHIEHDKLQWLKDIVDIIDAHRFEDDFCNTPCLVTEDGCGTWEINEMPRVSGLAAPACNDMVNGVLVLTTGGDASDYGELVQACECWKLSNCYPLYAEIRFKLSEITNSAFWFGLVTGESYFVTPADYVVFHKDDTDASIEFANIITGGVINDTDTGIDLEAATWYRLGFHWDGGGTLRWFVIQDGDYPQTVLAAGSHITNIPTTELQLGFGIQQGAAAQAAVSMYIDYVKCVQKRVIE